MTRDEILKLAREAGFNELNGGLRDDGSRATYFDCWPEQIERFAALVAEAEREASAKVCDARYMGDNNREDIEARRCAAAIRARGNK